ncbi:hypothetical protein A3860_26045 [Niastella vici]|uniref:Swt1-like HEPN domain-containing protein n=1 Tax=Niastella vici TaxID=1703345 RepID=A0A1V9FWN2_9BACT|nr:hypothetical protein [Niastella vici]OQP62779.1 hypothetical protein A3860_26045 [Niastella vici]
MDFCPITGVPITLFNLTEGGIRYVYKTEVLGLVEWTDVAYMEAPSVLSLEDTYILAGVCRNNRLNDVQPTRINSAFLRTLKNLDIPYDFESRAKLLLQHLYNSGGKEYKSLSIRTAGDASLTYSSPEEFERIMAYIKDEGWIRWEKRNPTKITIIYQAVRITKEGIAILNNTSKQASSASIDIENRNLLIDNLETRLRNTIVETLTKETGKNNWEDLITGDARSALKARIRQHTNNHPGTNSQDFAMLNKAIQFFDVDHLKKVIINAHWAHFESIFQDKMSVERFFDDFANLRHTIKHNRELTALVSASGNAAIIWITMALDNYAKNSN